MDEYIARRITLAKEWLETGVQLGNPSFVKQAMDVYTSLDNIVESKSKENVTENMIRACSAMCILDPKNALAYLDCASKYNDEHPVINNNYGYVYHQLGEWEKSIVHYEKCLFIDDAYATAYLGIIDLYQSLRRYKLELEYCKKAAKKCPACPEILNSLAMALVHNQKFSSFKEITALFEKAMTLVPSRDTKTTLLINTGRVHGIVGNPKIALACFLQAIENSPEGPSRRDACKAILDISHFFTDCESDDPVWRAVLSKFSVKPGQCMDETIDRLHQGLMRTLCGDLESVALSRKIQGPISRKIMLGYMFQSEPTGIPMEWNPFSRILFSHHNADMFHVILYSNFVYDAECATQLKGVSYRCVLNASTQEIVEQIHKDAIDILVDLSSGNANSDVMAQRPAQIILSYLNPPTESGFPWVRRISDKFTENCTQYDVSRDPECLDRIGEKRILLPGTSLCYMPDATDASCLKSFQHLKPKTSTVTFGCFADLLRINDRVIDTWKRILDQVPRARLLLNNVVFQDPSVVQQWKDRFDDLQHRVVFLKVSRLQHAKYIRLVDIYLDPFPCSDAILTAMCLSMNVPVITFAEAARPLSRVSGSVLQSMGSEENACIAATPEEYVDKAVALVNALPHFPSVRRRFLSSVFSNPVAFMTQYEQALADAFVEQFD